MIKAHNEELDLKSQDIQKKVEKASDMLKIQDDLIEKLKLSEETS